MAKGPLSNWGLGRNRMMRAGWKLGRRHSRYLGVGISLVHCSVNIRQLEPIRVEEAKAGWGQGTMWVVFSVKCKIIWL